MDANLITAVAGLGGATIGGAMSFLGSWVAQQKQLRAQWFGQDRMRRQDLYQEFIQEASKSFADALQHDKPNVASIVVLYEKLSRMRIISSPAVLFAAEQATRQIIDALLQPEISLTGESLREMFETGSADVLRSFGEACRAEFDELRAKQF
ncbi:MAG: hypothetical protein JO283_13750 [Bradyrhizobium sp.]|nr:hypothetical protein [Bradyrhizobium sp.]